jgi:hypothetical protein
VSVKRPPSLFGMNLSGEVESGVWQRFGNSRASVLTLSGATVVMVPAGRSPPHLP